MDKNADLEFNISAISNQQITSNIRFSTQDEGSAKLTFYLYKDGVALPLNAVEGKLAMRMADGSIFRSNIVIVDKVNGVAEYSLTTEQIKHYGRVNAELYLNYENNQKMSVHRFSFTIDRALIDADISLLTEFYVDDFSNLKETINVMAEETTATIQAVGESVEEAKGKAEETIALIEQNDVVKKQVFDESIELTALQIENNITVQSEDTQEITMYFLQNVNNIRTRQIISVQGFYSLDDDFYGKYRVLAVTGEEVWFDVKDANGNLEFQISKKGELRPKDSLKKLKVMRDKGSMNVMAFGVKTDGSDSADIIEFLANSLEKGELIFPILRYTLGRTVQTPVGVHIVGTSGRKGGTEFSPMVGGIYTEDYLFFMNISTSNPNTWVNQYPNNDSGGARNVCIINNVKGTIATPIIPKINGFKFAGSYHFEKIRYEGVGTLIGKPNVYTDKVKIIDIDGQWRPNNTDYLIYLPGLGDAYDIRQIGTGYVGSSSPTSDINWGKGLFLGAARGADIYGLINGIHTINGGTIIDVHGAHLEGGRLDIIDAEVNIHDNLFFTNDWSKDPRIRLLSVNSQYRNRYVASIKNNIFVQDAVIHSGWSKTLIPDIMFHSAYHVTMEDNFRQVTTSNAISNKQFMGIIICDQDGNFLEDYNIYTHILSAERIHFANNKIPLTFNTRDFRASISGFDTPVLKTDYGVKWKTDAVKYFYQMQVLIDPVRLIGRNVTGSEVNISINANSDIVELPINWGSNLTRSGCILRVYRGIESGYYNRYVDIPVVSLRSLIDDGLSLNGFSWNLRTAGFMNALNNAGLCGQARYLDGIMEVFSDYTGQPTVGTWKNGDKVILFSPLDTSDSKTRYEWLRANDSWKEKKF